MNPTKQLSVPLILHAIKSKTEPYFDMSIQTADLGGVAWSRTMCATLKGIRVTIAMDI